MDAESLPPFSRQGGWQSSYWLYFKGAKNNLSLLLIDKEVFDKKLAELVHDYPDDEHGYIDHIIRPNVDKLIISSTVIQILCCMSVEAFINYYGVKLIGEEPYKRNYEKLGITQKLEILLAIHRKVNLPKNSEITKLLRKMFDKRNNLVHPKTKEISFDDLLQGKFGNINSNRNIIAEAIDRVQEMESFYTYFQEVDPEIKSLVQVLLADEDDAAAIFS